MKCVVCKIGDTAPGYATALLERSGAVIVFQAVPADVCTNRGEEYVSGKVGANLLDQAQRSATLGTQVDIRAYVAA